MSRTVHHVTYKNRDSTQDPEPSSGFYVFRQAEKHRIWDLRYSAAVETAAEKDGHRVRPDRVIRTLEAHSYPRTNGLRRIGYAANRQERGLRAADRVAARAADRLLRGAEDAADAAWDIEFADPRHRHFAVWDAW